jgi:hypothetical protein
MDLYNLEHGHAKGDVFLGTTNAWGADANRPNVRNLIEVASGAASVGVGTLASHFVEAPALPVPLVTKLLDETTRVKMRTPGAVIMDLPVIRKLRASLFVKFRQLPRSGKLQNHP